MKKLLLVLFLFLGFFCFSQKSNKPKLQATYDAIKAAGIREPEFAMAQCIQETGWINCKKCCLRFHNLFGFYVKGNKCKKFSSDEDCIKYYKTWQDKRYDRWRKKFPKADYYHFLKYVKYAANPKYNIELKPKVAWVKKYLK